MTAPPDGISEVEWLSWPPSARAIILDQQEEIELLRGQLSSMASELVNLRERIGRSSRNSSKRQFFQAAILPIRKASGQR